jgi:ABC-type glycerol-3-phosphate transport system substrate-binding protein
VPEINPDYDPGGVHYWKISDLYDKYGGLDLGYSTTNMTAMNQTWLSVFQPFIKGEISAEEALETFEKEFNKILAGE